MSAQWDLHHKQFSFMLRLMGLWPEDSYQFDWYTIYSIFVFTLFICGHNFAQVISIFFVDDLKQATAVFVIMLSVLIVVMKFYVISANIKTIKRLMGDINKEEFLPRSRLQKERGRSVLKFWESISLFFGTTAGFTVLIWTMIPILNGSYKQYNLPFHAWYPFDYKKPFWYELTYLHQLVGITYIAIVTVNTDCLISGFMSFVGVQCELLCDNLRKLQPMDNISVEFLKCIQHHQEILRYAHDANTAIDSLVLIQFFTSAVSLGFTMFQLTLISFFSNEFFSVLGYASTILSQIFMYCWFGNEVQFKSGIISTAAYEFDWTDLPVTLEKDLVFFILRSQKQIYFTALGLFPLSLNTFMRIIKSAWSYFAILQTINMS